MSVFNLNPACFPWRVMRQAGIILAVVGLGLSLRGDDAFSEILPQPVDEDTFSALKTLSPFRRSVGIKDSIILTGLARIENDVVATLFDSETSESFLVSRNANPQGWQLVGVRGDEADLESLTAKIQVTGGEVISIRYEKAPQRTKANSGSRPSGGTMKLSSSQLSEAKRAAINYRGEHPADGYPRLPPPEIVSKLSRMTVQQRESITREMLLLRNRGLGMQERQKIYGQKIDQALKGRR